MDTSPRTSQPAPASVSDLVRRRAEQRPAQPAFVFVPDSGEAPGEASWSYSDLDRRASAVAAAVSRQAAPGDRAALVFPPGLDFLAAFFGCLYAGVLPVPATFPKPRRPSSRLDAIAHDCTPTLALTTSGARATMKLDEQSAAVRDIPWIAVDHLQSTSTPFALVPQREADAAFLQYTSGSTSQPRGVVVTHGNLLHNLDLIRRGFDLPAAEDADEVLSAVFWLPAYHDMGLIGGILSPLYLGLTSYLMSPAAFLQRPVTWLEMMSRTGACISGAPNFAYELCTRKVSTEDRDRLDLSAWKVAFCGAEPIDPHGLEAFARHFDQCGFSESSFYPCYGLAEATLMASGGAGPQKLRTIRADRSRLAAHELAATAARNGDVLTLVSCGNSLGDQQLLVVDPTSRTECGPGKIGEIWIRGKSVADGYWKHPEENNGTFGGVLADGRGPFLRTGDLGSFVDGELYITGRLKDVIIIRGRNLYPQDIERVAQKSHPALEAGAAFSTGDPGHERLVVVHQVARERRRDDLAPVVRAIRAAIVEEFDVDPHAIVLLRPGALPLTTSGKVQRRRCRDLYESQALDALTSWSGCADDQIPLVRNDEAASSDPRRPNFLDRLASLAPDTLAAELQQWMLAWLAERVEVPGGELAPYSTFAELGVDSLTAVELNIEFEDVLKLHLPPAAAWTYPTPGALSQYLAECLLTQQSGDPTVNPVDSWFQSMEEDARL